MQLRDIARACHELNRAYCVGLGDTSQPRWELAPDWQTKSAMQGVNAAINDPHATPESMHDNWTEVKIRDGWVYGAVKDADAKTHPCLVDYGKLPLEQRIKDTLFLHTVRTLEPLLES